ncbi:MAG: hypothetical protein HYY62_08400 [Deltaproteobacteria bacterium]|nr:hypothetical protein [Deltaproteobacteria bacterium]
MKKGIVTVFLSVLFITSAQASGSLLVDLFLSQARTLDVIDWKVGDAANYNMQLGFIGKGTVKKTATKEEEGAIWIETNAKTPLGDERVETLISRADGKILKLIVNGQEQKYEEHEIELISKDAAEITVPAGTFKTIHVKVKDKTDASDVEAWINPRDIPLGGIVKSSVAKSFLTVTLELTSFSRKER